MANWSLYVENYGKIAKAEIECAPLTLIVGDNNCGKSYLMSLLWGLHNYGAVNLFQNDSGQISDDEIILRNWIKENIAQALPETDMEADVEEIGTLCERLINLYIDKNKDKLLAWIFNSEKMTAGKIQIRFNSEAVKGKKVIFSKRTENNIAMKITDGDGGISAGFEVMGAEIDSSLDFLLKGFLSGILEIPYRVMSGKADIYLPAARTGFMLAKDIVNTVGRNQTFNVENEDKILSPFTRPINQFLDVINELSATEQSVDSYVKIAEIIENGMVTGNIEISGTPNREIMYSPQGEEQKNMSLRTVSAVVTELSPLILMLKHLSRINSLYYEEPEMCLHPQLQHQMGRIIARMINDHIQVIATTHSDILIQSINNKIVLENHPQKPSICDELGYGEEDLIHKDMVKVYQFQEEHGKSSLVELSCGENGFAVPTFNNALDDIMEEAYKVQGSEDE